MCNEIPFSRFYRAMLHKVRSIPSQNTDIGHTLGLCFRNHEHLYNISQNALHNSHYFHLLPTVLYYLTTTRPILLDLCYYAPGDRIKRCTPSVLGCRQQ